MPNIFQTLHFRDLKEEKSHNAAGSQIEIEIKIEMNINYNLGF